MTQFALYEMPKKECRRVAISVPIPKWLPPSLALWLRRRMAERPEGKLTVATRFSKGERAAMKRRRPVPISAWAEKHRVLEMSAIRGRWRNVFTPYLTGIMDVSGLPGVETVIICKSPQTGGSECGHNIVGYCIDRLPGPVMYVFPDELTARENAKDRIIPMIEASPRLRQYMTGYGTMPPACASTCCTCRFTSAGPVPSRGSGTSPSASSSSTSWTSTRTRKTRHRPSRWRRSARRHGGPGARS